MINPRSLLPAAALLAALAFNPGRAVADESADFDSLPAAILKTARAEVGTAKVVEVEQTFEEGQHATEVEYVAKGKKMAVVIAPDGTLIQKENRMSPGDAPAPVQAGVLALFHDGKISHIKEVERKTEHFYELSVKADGKSHQLKLGADGKPVK